MLDVIKGCPMRLVACLFSLSYCKHITDHRNILFSLVVATDQ